MASPSSLLILVFQTVFIALYIVGVVRSRGVARVLLAAWVAVSIATPVLTMAGGAVIDSLGFSGYGLILGVVNAIGSILLGVALIIGRPGYRGEYQNLDSNGYTFPQRSYGGPAQPSYGGPAQPPYGGPAQPPYGPPAQGYGQSADRSSAPDWQG